MSSKRLLTGMLGISLTAMIASPALGELSVDEVVEPETDREYFDPEAVVLTDGFWAKSGSDVIVTTRELYLQMSDDRLTPVPPGRSSPLCPLNCLSGSKGKASTWVEIGRETPLPNPASYYAIDSIEVIEKGRDPCNLRLFGRMADPRFPKSPSSRLLATFAFKECEDLAEEKSPDSRIVTLAPFPTWFIRGFQVCIDRQGLRGALVVKGLKVLPGHAESESAEVIPVDAVHTHPLRKNCKNKMDLDGKDNANIRSGWSHWSMCPEGQLATGVTLHHTEGEKFTGMSIICKYLRRLPGPAPVADALGF